MLADRMRLMGGEEEMLESIQHVTGTMSVNETTCDITISAVNRDCSIILFGEVPCLGTRRIGALPTFTSATNVRLTRNTSNTTHSREVNIQVIEFKAAAVKSKQTGDITSFTDYTAKDTTITSVDKTKSLVLLNFRSTSTDDGHLGIAWYLKNNTTLRVIGGQFFAAATVHYQVIEFK